MGAGHCPWGGYTDWILCPLAAVGEVVTDGHTDGKKWSTIIMEERTYMDIWGQADIQQIPWKYLELF